MRLTCVLMLLIGPEASAQYIAKERGDDPRSRRAFREKAVAFAGSASRELVESEGDDAAAALLACSSSTARRLVEFHSCGGLARIPKAKDVLKAISLHGDDVAIFVLQESAQLSDMDAVEAFCRDPLQYALRLRPVADGAAEVRAQRLHAQTGWWAIIAADQRLVVVVVAVLVLVGAALWKRRVKGGGS